MQLTCAQKEEAPWHYYITLLVHSPGPYWLGMIAPLLCQTFKIHVIEASSCVLTCSIRLLYTSRPDLRHDAREEMGRVRKSVREDMGEKTCSTVDLGNHSLTGRTGYLMASRAPSSGSKRGKSSLAWFRYHCSPEGESRQGRSITRCVAGQKWLYVEDMVVH